jgi:hypothetical protein
MGAVALCLVVPAIATVVVHYRPKVGTPLRACGLVAVFFASCVLLVCYEAPTIQLHDWMTTGTPSLETIPGSPTFRLKPGSNSYINSRYTYISKLLIASKLQKLYFDHDKAELPVPSGKVEVPILRCFPIKPDEARDRIQAQYSIVVLVCLASWIYLSIIGRAEPSTLFGRILYRTELVVVALLMVVSVFIPYVYGKLISSTEFPLVDISYKEPAPNSTSDKEQVWPKEVPLIATTEKGVSILFIQNGLAKVVQIPRDHLLYLHVREETDVLRELLEQRAPLSSRGGAT